MRQLELADVLGYRWQYNGPVFVCGVGGGGPATPDTGAGGAGEGGGSAAPAAPTGAPAAPAAPTLDWSTAPAHFRHAYEKLKTDHEALRTTSQGAADRWKPLEQLGAPEDLQRGYTIANKMYTEMTTLATAQGYSQDEIDEAFDKDPAAALTFLREEARKGGAATVNADSAPKTSSDAPPDVELKTVRRPRRCEWVGCGRRVGEAVVVPSWGAGIPVLFFFCEEHRPLFLEWRNDRSRSVKFRLGPAVRKKVHIWLASSNGWQRLWLVIVGLLGVAIGFLTVTLTVASWPEDYALLWILAGLCAWGVCAAMLYGIGVLVAWVRRGFSKAPAVS